MRHLRVWVTVQGGGKRRDVIEGETAGWDMAATPLALPQAAFLSSNWSSQPLFAGMAIGAFTALPGRLFTCNAMSSSSGALSIGFQRWSRGGSITIPLPMPPRYLVFCDRN
jgi:hypothetical protein